MNRREFIGMGGAAFAIAATGRAWGADAPSNRLRLAIMGCNETGRGIWVMRAAIAVPGVEIATVCDVDNRAMDFAAAEILKLTGKVPRKEKDIRNVLADKDIDGVICETPDHWHAPLTWMAVRAGKAVYVEKPCCFNGEEGELLLKAWRETGKVVQIGSQRRSSKVYREVIPQLASLIGEIKYARCWYTNARGPIGKGREAPVPEWLDWDLWQGPAPRTVYHDNYLPYKWHWFRRWGTGEMGNNSPHFLDVARWGMGLGYPVRTISLGARLFAPGDDWQWPDTQSTAYQFGDGCVIDFGCYSSFKHKAPHDIGTGCMFYGPGGAVLFHPQDAVYQYDTTGKEVKKWIDSSASDWIQSSTGASYLDTNHVANWVEAIRRGDQGFCHANPGVAVATSQMAHAANMANDSGETIRLDGKTGRLLNAQAEVRKLWSREYEKGWGPQG